MILDTEQWTKKELNTRPKVGKYSSLYIRERANNLINFKHW